MEYKIIQVNNYLLAVVNDKKRGWFYCVRRKSFFHDEGEDVLCCNGDLSVEAHLPLNGANIIENLPLLPPFEQEDDVEKLALLYGRTIPSQMDENEVDYAINGFYNGYNKAKEKYKYTEEDIENAFNSGRGYGVPDDIKDLNSFMKSISQPKMPVGFECEMEMCENNDVVFEDGSFNKSPYRLENKKIKNSQGQTVWVGKYIFND